jgi:competence protein ComEA
MTGPPAAGGELIVDIEGKVRHPGIVRVPKGSRVIDALEAAGGALPGAQTAGLNLARVLTDGELILVGVPPPAGVAPTAAASGVPAGPLDLNTATLDQLEELPGVGPVLAQRILDYRLKQGRFASVDELRAVSGIGDQRFAELKDLVRV